jgi:hypothetical protein
VTDLARAWSDVDDAQPPPNQTGDGRCAAALAELMRAEARAAVRLNGRSSSLTWNCASG